MAAKNSAHGGDCRPRPLHGSRSFSRMEEPSSSPTSPRKRASTMQVSSIPAIPEARRIDDSPELPGKSPKADVFENRDDEDHAEPEPSMPAPELQLPSTLDELPIEIRSLTERFLESLNAKVHPAPLTADVLSDMFQDFYERAASQISIHIATLASRIGRPKESSPAPSRNGKARARAGSGAKRGESPASASGGEMLTASEVTDRKKARKMLELKRVALEEAVERGVCEKVYERIWKHRSTDDDARDEKLRSKTAALSLVGIGLKELHMDHDPAKQEVRQTAEEKEQEIYESLSAAREALQRMDNEHYPLGKLQHLTAAHKSVVETLSQLFPSSASADEILPTLIYTLITTPPEGINVVSNLNFIQRFRSSSKVDGEAAYCLVNLEASISFLETVDLSSLRADELPQGPAKNTSRPSTPIHDKQAPPQPSANRALKPETTPVSALSADQSTPDTSDKHLPSPTAFSSTPLNRPGMQHRRLSSLVQAQADRFEVGRDNFLNAADKVYDSINGTLENSLKSIFGRFKDQVPGDSPLPKTLEDARKLVSSPALTPEDEYPSSLHSGHSSPLVPSDDPLSSKSQFPASSNTEKDNKMLELLGGRKQLSREHDRDRDRSVDSTKSAISTSSGKRVAFSSATSTTPASTTTNANKSATQQAPAKDDPINAAANFMNSINPLNRFGVPSFPRFGAARAASNPLATTPAQTPALEKSRQLGDIVESPSAITTPAKEETLPVLERTKSHVSDAGEDLNAVEALAELRKIKPPRKRFLEVGSANELKIGEVEDLLMEYRRLAKAIGEAIAT